MGDDFPNSIWFLRLVKGRGPSRGVPHKQEARSPSIRKGTITYSKASEVPKTQEGEDSSRDEGD